MVDVLVMDPSRGIRNTLKEKLEYEGFSVGISDGTEDILMGDKSGENRVLLFSQEIAESDFGSRLFDDIINRGDISVIIISAEKDVSKAVDFVHRGAVDFIPRPMDMNRLLSSVRSVLQQPPQRHLPTPSTTKRTTLHQSGFMVDDIIGSGSRISHIKNLIDKVAPSEARVLITGANGTGKELVARWLHRKSMRADHPFIEVNCAAIPSELIESELFGHEKGAFTSAIKQRKGKFEQADGGTLFLDEIGDMSLSAQAKVLRALQEHRISRVGSDKDIEVNVRVLAATNKNLREEIAAKNFREDLYHRLSVIEICVPSLSERKEDIGELVEFFIKQICDEYGISPKTITEEAVKMLEKMEWSGNIRQLRNVVERLIILSGEKITASDITIYASLTV